jgi:hypothetical protein
MPSGIRISHKKAQEPQKREDSALILNFCASCAFCGSIHLLPRMDVVLDVQPSGARSNGGTILSDDPPPAHRRVPIDGAVN